MINKRKQLQKLIINLSRYGNYEPREYVINDDKKIIYLNNSKVACTSIKIAIFGFNQIKDDNSVHCILRSHRKDEINKKDYKNYYIFTYVRNPFERLVSLYKNKVCEEKQYFDDYLFGFMSPDKGFEVFVKKIMLIPDFLADRHFRSQYSLIYKNGKCMVDFVGKIENIDESYKKLEKRFNLDSLPHYNSTKKTDWMDFYSVDLAKKVYKRYKKDFKQFGYTHYYYELLKHI